MHIDVVNLSKVMAQNQILSDINLEMDSGKIYGLIGKNGSGKTMLMRAICGLIVPSSGNITIDGKKLGEDISFPQSVGALIENPGFISSYSGYKNLKFLAQIQNIISEDDMIRTLTEVGLDPDDKRKYRKYSLGMKQKLGIAAAIMEKPQLLILDEPFNALDEETTIKVREIIQNRRAAGALIILSCHDRDEIETLCDVIVEIKSGKISDIKRKRDDA